MRLLTKQLSMTGSFNLALQLLGIKVQWLLGVNRFVKFLWNISTNNAAKPARYQFCPPWACFYSKILVLILLGNKIKMKNILVIECYSTSMNLMKLES